MTKTLPLGRLFDRHPGLTEAIGAAYSEAAAVCLSRHHQSPVVLALHSHGIDSECTVEWNEPDQRARNAWANEIDTTEQGAYAVSLAALELQQGLVAFSRAQTLTGADYYVAPIGSSLDDLEECLRLEVSGTDKGDQLTIKQRLNAKMRQAAEGDSNLPAIASVVGFRARVVAIARVVETS